MGLHTLQSLSKRSNEESSNRKIFYYSRNFHPFNVLVTLFFFYFFFFPSQFFSVTRFLFFFLLEIFPVT